MSSTSSDSIDFPKTFYMKLVDGRRYKRLFGQYVRMFKPNMSKPEKIYKIKDEDKNTKGYITLLHSEVEKYESDGMIFTSHNTEIYKMYNNNDELLYTYDTSNDYTESYTKKGTFTFTDVITNHITNKKYTIKPPAPIKRTMTPLFAYDKHNNQVISIKFDLKKYMYNMAIDISGKNNAIGESKQYKKGIRKVEFENTNDDNVIAIAMLLSARMLTGSFAQNIVQYY